MSLDTVLQIGKAFRESDNSLRYFKYVEPCTSKVGNNLLYITIPVKEDFKLDWNNVRITPQNERDSLYYLKFKTSDSDGLVKYIFGDIYYEKTAKISKKDGSITQGEGGNYRLSNPQNAAAYRQSSFRRGNADFNSIVKEDSICKLNELRKAMQRDIELLERILEYPTAIDSYFSQTSQIPFYEFLKDKETLYLYTIKHNLQTLSNTNRKILNISHSADELDEEEKSKLSKISNISIFIHFEYPNKKQWYQFTAEFSLVSKKMLADFFEKTDNGYVLQKTLYKTLCSGDKKNDIQFPAFKLAERYKSKSFSEDDMQNLFYALAYTNKGRQIKGTDIKLIVLPRGMNLNAKNYDDFQEKNNEEQVVINNEGQMFDSNILFDFSDDVNGNITSFDLIFSKKGGLTSPDKDLMEISSIEKSKLRQTKERIAEIAKRTYGERQKYMGTDSKLRPFSITYSFSQILGNPQTDNNGKIKFVVSPKYQSHLLKVLPQIYSDTYLYDDVLLPAFIQNLECSVRAGDNKFNFLKFDLIFLLRIQNNIKDQYMKITKSESYQLGLMLGALAKNLSQEINSFEKNYVGNLTRRIGTISDFIKLKNDIEQKLVMHDKTKFTFQLSYDLSQKIKESTGQYDKEECAFGFMESYFKPLSKKTGSECDSNGADNNNK